MYFIIWSEEIIYLVKDGKNSREVKKEKEKEKKRKQQWKQTQNENIRMKVKCI